MLILIPIIISLYTALHAALSLHCTVCIALSCNAVIFPVTCGSLGLTSIMSPLHLNHPPSFHISSETEGGEKMPSGSGSKTEQSPGSGFKKKKKKNSASPHVCHPSCPGSKSNRRPDRQTSVFAPHRALQVRKSPPTSTIKAALRQQALS